MAGCFHNPLPLDGDGVPGARMDTKALQKWLSGLGSFIMIGTVVATLGTIAAAIMAAMELFKESPLSDVLMTVAIVFAIVVAGIVLQLVLALIETARNHHYIIPPRTEWGQWTFWELRGSEVFPVEPGTYDTRTMHLFALAPKFAMHVQTGAQGTRELSVQFRTGMTAKVVYAFVRRYAIVDALAVGWGELMEESFLEGGLPLTNGGTIFSYQLHREPLATGTNDVAEPTTEPA